MLNPLRSEAEAFRLLLYVVAVVGTIVVIVLIVRALTVSEGGRGCRHH